MIKSLIKPLILLWKAWTDSTFAAVQTLKGSNGWTVDSMDTTLKGVRCPVCP